jgi:16S rRNA (cytosine967-C5)-methyltransferase
MKYPRALAVRVLTQVLSDFHSLDEVLVAESAHLESEAVSWLYEICSGTLRWKGRLDWILDSLASHKKPSGWLRKVLLLAVYQLIAQDRAPQAQVVSETVEEIKNREGEAPARFANACLRKVAEQAQEWRGWDFPKASDPVEQAAWGSLPPWMWNKLVHQRGLAWTQDFAQATLDRPRLWVRSRNSDWKSDWVDPGPVPCSWQSHPARGGSVIRQPGFVEGQWIVQDISSQVLIAEVSDTIHQTLAPPALASQGERPRLTALDLCAAPGGKSVGLAWSGFQVSATEIKPERAALLQDTIARAAPEIEYLAWDQLAAASAAGSKRSWDLVWVDAPCSGSGILRRHPDVRWLRKEQELVALTQQQKQVLRQGWERVQPGGFLVYSVCSIFADEGERVIAHFKKELQSSGVEVAVIRDWLLCPQQAPFGDGFWAALLRKPESS